MSDCLSRADVDALTVWILSECERLGVTFEQWLDLEPAKTTTEPE